MLKDPDWWMRDVFTALLVAVIVAGGSILGQKLIDDDRAQREEISNADQNRHRERLENLRFVRDASTPTRTALGRSRTSTSKASTSSDSNSPVQTSPTPSSTTPS